jgi:hypothetical protein
MDCGGATKICFCWLREFAAAIFWGAQAASLFVSAACRDLCGIAAAFIV